MARGNLDIAQIQDAQKHGASVKIQLSDGLGVNGNLPKFASDGSITDSGVISSNAGLWQQGSGGAIYYNSGNVGIGQSAPPAQLSVLGAGTYAPSLAYQSAASFIVNASASECAIGLQPTHEVWIQARNSASAAQPLLLNPLGGNVGIGTASPVALCEVNGTLRAVGGASPASGAGLELLYAGGTGYAQAYDRTGGAYKQLVVNGNPLILNSPGNPGNVGIGTTTPQSLLTLQTVGYTTLRFNDTGGTPTGGAFWRLITGASTNQFALQMNTASAGDFSSVFISFCALATGKFGLGTAAPWAGLTVSAGPGGDPSLVAQAAANVAFQIPGGIELVFNQATSQGTYYMQARNAGAASSLALNPAGGNVGIGTIGPVVALHCYGTTNNTGNIKAQTAADGAYIYVQNNGAYKALQGLNNAGQIDFAIGHYGMSGAGMAFYYGTGPTEAMRIASNGNVGIGTASPQAGLQITRGGAFAMLRMGDGSNDYIYSHDGSTGALIMNGTQSSFSGFVWQINNGTEIVRFQTATGYVGINNGSPGARLHFGGGAYCDGATFTNACSAAIKSAPEAIDTAAILAKLEALPVGAWRYNEFPAEKHIGPTAEDWYGAFGLGNNRPRLGGISTVDGIGVALAAIKALAARVKQLEGRN